MVVQEVLNESELAFLRYYGFAPDDVHDGRMQRKDVWQRIATAENKPLVLGTKCRQARHRLRTRAGHCAQCDPKKLAFQARHTADQYVYIAGSREAGLIKIGTCSNLAQREHQVRSEKYGGAGDWVFIFTVEMRNAGDIEGRTQRRLGEYAITRPYWKDGIEQQATELLQCSFTRAMNMLMDVGKDAKLSEPWKSHRSFLYEFTEPAAGL
jgi:hypothetical protein